MAAVVVVVLLLVCVVGVAVGYKLKNKNDDTFPIQVNHISRGQQRRLVPYKIQGARR